MKRIYLAPVLALAIGASAPAAAQVGGGIPVFDTSTFAQTLATVKNTLSMIDQGKQQIQQANDLFNSLNKLTNVNSIAALLNNPQVRNLLPPEAQDMARLMSGDVSSTGAIGTKAQALLSRYKLGNTGLGTSDADQAYKSAIDEVNGQAATQGAVAETAYDVANQRTQGLEQLRSSLDSASDAKAVMDIQARIAAENAHIQNDQMKLQAVAMREQAAATLKIQQDTQANLRTRLQALGETN